MPTTLAEDEAALAGGALASEGVPGGAPAAPLGERLEGALVYRITRKRILHEQLAHAVAITRELNSLTALLGPPPSASSGGGSASGSAAATDALSSGELSE